MRFQSVYYVRLHFSRYSHYKEVSSSSYCHESYSSFLFIRPVYQSFDVVLIREIHHGGYAFTFC